MNQQTKILGMQPCHFKNSHGLPHPEMRCSLRSLMILSKELIHRHPAFYKRYFGVKRFRYNNINQRNRNQLLFWNKEADGIKTGNTKEAGFNLIVSTLRDYRLITGVMGAKTAYLRANDAAKLFNHAYIYYKRYIHYRANEPVAQIKIWRGHDKRLSVGLEESLYTTLPYRKRENFTTKIVVPRIIRAPILKNEPVGRLILVFQDGEILSRRLIALKTVEPVGFFRGAWHEALIFLGR